MHTPRVLRFFLLAGFFPLGAAFLPAESLDSLEAITIYAREHNLTYRSAEWEARKAYNDIPGIWKLEESSLSGTISYDDENRDIDVETTLSLSVLEQLSLSAGLTDDFDGRLQLTISPLAHSDTLDQAVLSYRRAQAYADELAVTIENDAVSASLTWMAAETDLAIQEETAFLLEQAYGDEKIRYAAGESTLDDVRDALMEWSASRIDLSSKQREAESSRMSMYGCLGAEPEEVTVHILGISELKDELGQLQATLNPDDNSSQNTYSVVSAHINTDSLRKKVDATWVFDPNLTVTAGISVDYRGSESIGSGAITLSISPADYLGDERKEYIGDLEVAMDTAKQTEIEAAMSLEQAVLALTHTAENRQSAELELEEARELVDEAEFLYTRGEVSALEHDETILLYRQNEADLFCALVDEYAAWLTLRIYNPSK